MSSVRFGPTQVIIIHLDEIDFEEEYPEQPHCTHIIVPRFSRYYQMHQYCQTKKNLRYRHFTSAGEYPFEDLDPPSRLARFSVFLCRLIPCK
jgi:hypothetical protein